MKEYCIFKSSGYDVDAAHDVTSFRHIAGGDIEVEVCSTNITTVSSRAGDVTGEKSSCTVPLRVSGETCKLV